MTIRKRTEGATASLLKLGRSWTTVAAVIGCVAGVSACNTLDELLEAELPGQVVDSALNDPALAETLVAGAQADFECGLQGHLLAIEAGWANAFQYVIFQVEMIRVANRQARTVENGTGECTSNRDPFWFIMHRGRFQSADAARRILAAPQGSVEDRDFLVGKALAYEGYATQLLSEAWCEMVFDGEGEDGVVTRDAAMQRAEDRFTSAIQHAQTALSGSRAAEAQDILDLALVGRARVRLNRGDMAGALSDAQQVTPGFIYYATYDNSPSRRNNMVTRLEDGFNVHPRDRSLTVGGMPDPRVPVETIGQHSSSGVGEWWVQRKYADDGSDIPFASWREAQLMIAEIQGGQTAVDIINDLRATVADLPWVASDHPGLPEFVSNDAGEIMDTVMEERRRELYLQGVKFGDDLRSNNTDTWDTGTSPVNAPIGTDICIPLPEVEFL